MKSDSIQVVIVQTDPSILRLIELMLKNEKNLGLTLLTDPQGALAACKKLGADVLITGQCFYKRVHKSKLYHNSRFASAPFFDGEHVFAFPDIRTGNQLAELARAECPELLVLRYSTTPGTQDFVCGDLNKLRHPMVVCDLLRDFDFQDAVRARRVRQLPAREHVRWYGDNCPESWNRSEGAEVSNRIIDSETLTEYVQSNDLVRRLDKEVCVNTARPEWSPHPSCERLAKKFSYLGVNTLDQLDDALADRKEVLARFAHQEFEKGIAPWKYRVDGVSLHYLCELMAAECGVSYVANYLERFYGGCRLYPDRMAFSRDPSAIVGTYESIAR
jgi:hypothetical protein